MVVADDSVNETKSGNTGSRDILGGESDVSLPFEEGQSGEFIREWKTRSGGRRRVVRG
jgi:hypothetical protein